MGSLSDTQARQAEKAPAGVRCVRVRRMSRSLDFYLALGFDVARTADGWALLRANAEQGDVGDFVLEQRRTFRAATAPVLYLHAIDLVALCQRLKGVGASVGARTYSTHAPHGAFAVADPDGNAVLVSGSVDTTGTATVPVPRPASRARSITTVGA